MPPVVLGARARLVSPAGRAALAVIEVSGPGARAALARVLDRAPPEAGHHALRALADPETGEPIDQVVCAALEAERFEIGGHAGPAVIERALAALARAGCERLAEAAPSALEEARTLLAARALAAAAAGRLDPGRPPWARALAALAAPPRVVLAGPPNAGKSTLLNALIERERAITAPSAGTTRDVLEVEAAMAGAPVRLADTAGQGGGAPLDALDELGRARARAAADLAEVLVVVLDGARPLDDDGRVALERARAGRPLERGAERAIVVLAKRDLGAALSPGVEGVPGDAIALSARTGEGLDRLRGAIARAALGADPVALERLLDGGR